MSGISDKLRKAASLFVELDDVPKASSPSPMSDEEFQKAMSAPLPADLSAPAGGQARTVEQLVRDAPGPNLDEVKVPAASAQVSAMKPDGTVDFNAIYTMASLTPTAFSSEQFLELLATMPADLSMDTKRASLKVMLGAMTKNMGVSTDSIVADASRKLAALASYADGYSKQADEYVNRCELEISALEAQIAEKKHSIEDAKHKQVSMVTACTAEGDRLDDVLEFFTMDVAPSKLAP